MLLTTRSSKPRRTFASARRFMELSDMGYRSAWVFFVGFIFFTNLLLLNLMTGVVVENVLEAPACCFFLPVLPSGGAECRVDRAAQKQRGKFSSCPSSSASREGSQSKTNNPTKI